MSDDAQRTILAVMLASAAMTLAARLTVPAKHPLRKDGSVVRIAVGTVAASLLLMVVAKPQPGLAKMFSYMILLGTTYTYGPIIIAAFRGFVGKDVAVMSESEWKSSKKGKR